MSLTDVIVLVKCIFIRTLCSLHCGSNRRAKMQELPAMCVLTRISNHPAVFYDYLYLEINVFCVILLLFMVVRMGSYRKCGYSDFVLVCGAASISFLADALWIMMFDGAVPSSPVFMHALKDVYFFSNILLGYFWHLYTLRSLLGKSDKKRALVACPLLFVEGGLLAVNWFHPILFYMQDGNHYRGPFFALNYLLLYIYVISASLQAVVFSLRKEHFADRRTGILYALFPIAPGISGILQYYYPDIPVLCCSVAFFMMVICQEREKNLISMDPLTQLSNRRRFVELLKRRMDNPTESSKLYLYMLDIDNFKTINDTYGHPEGDRALTKVADALRLATKDWNPRPVLARYGGDEFMLYAVLPGEEERNKLMNDIEAALESLNEQDPTGASVAVSIGSAEWMSGMLPITLLKKADERLYEVKKKRHAVREA